MVSNFGVFEVCEHHTANEPGRVVMVEEMLIPGREDSRNP